MKAVLSTVLAAFLLAIPYVALSEDESEPSRGRLADGRAFRTDAQGNQLVDYIAELEMSVEQLNRKVNGLEFEVAEKQKQVDRLQSQGISDRKLAERDLLNGQAAKFSESVRGADNHNIPAQQFKESQPAVSCPPQECSVQVAPVQQLLEKTRFDLGVVQKINDKRQQDIQSLQIELQQNKLLCDQQLSKFQSEMAKFTCPKSEAGPELVNLRTQLNTANQQLSDARALIQASKTSTGSQIATLTSQLGDYQNKNQDLERQVYALKKQLMDKDAIIQAKNDQLLSSRTELQQVKTNILESTKPVVAVAQANTSQSDAATVATSNNPALVQPKFLSQKAAETVSEQPRASVSLARVRAVESIRGNLKAELNKIRDLVSTRDTLFQGYSQLGKELTFRPSQLVSSRNNSLAAIQQQLKNAVSVYELSGLARDIKEIRAKVSDDIELIKRMKRMG